MEFQLSYLLTLKYDAVKMLHSMCQKIWKTQQWSQDRKSLVFILIPKKGNAKQRSNYHTIALISQANKVMLKILQSRLQPRNSRYSSWFQKRQRNQRSNYQHPLAHQKARGFQKNMYFCFIDYAKPLTVWITTNCEKFLKTWEYQITLPAS